ncbi:KH domain, partial [Paramuricea clavata]
MSGDVSIFVPVPQECMGIIIGTRGRNINQLKQDTHTSITSCNGDNLEKESGFTVSGAESNCEEVRQAIRCRVDNASVHLMEPILQQFVHLLIREHGSDNFRGIEKNCGVKITWPKFSGSEKHVIFDIKGLRSNCERAREMLSANTKKWQDNEICQKAVSEADLGSQTHSK